MSGTWQVAANWFGGLPSGSVDATFNLSNTYIVTSSISTVAAKNLTISAGDVTFNPGSRALQAGTLNLSGGSLTTNSLVYGTAVAGQLGYTNPLNWTDGTITINGGTFKPQETFQFYLTSPLTEYWGSSVSGTSGGAKRATLNLLNGGTTAFLHSGTVTEGSFFVGHGGGKGTVNVDGNTSALNTALNGSAVNGFVIVGAGGTTISNVYYPGDGSLTVTNGGLAKGFAVEIGYYGGVGSVTVDGANSIISCYYDGIFVGSYRSSTTATRGSHGTLSLSNGGAANAVVDVSIGDNGGQGVINVGMSDGTDAGNTRLTAGRNLSVSSVNGNRADAGGILNVYAGGSVEVPNVLQTFTNTANSAATRVNLAGGSIKAGSIALQSSTHLNWTSGTLWLTGGASTTGGAVTVPAGGTLKGSGGIAGGLVTSNGNISPGDGSSIASFALSNGLAISSTGTLTADLDRGSSTGDHLDVTGTVDITLANLTFNLVNTTPGVPGPASTIVLINNDGTDPIVGVFNPATLPVIPGIDYSIDYAYNGNDVAIIFQAPEPSLALPLGAAAGLMRRRSRRLDAIRGSK